MKRLIFLLAALCALSLPSLSASVVAEPGHYSGNGGKFSFTLTAEGEIHHLRIHDRAVPSHAVHLKHGRMFHFDRRVQIFHYTGDVHWEIPTECELELDTSVPSVSPAVVTHRIRLHRAG